MSQITISKSDIIWAYLGSFFKVAANIILLPVVLKMLTNEELGMWYVFGSISQIVVLLDFGFASTIARNIAYAWCGVDALHKNTIGVLNENQETNFEYFKMVLQTCKIIYLIISSVALFLLLTGGVYYVSSLDSSCIYIWIIYSIGVALNLMYCYYTSFLRGIGAIAENNKAAIISKLVQIIVSILLLYFGYGLLGVSVAYLLSGIALRISSKLYFDNYEGIKHHLKAVHVNSSFKEIRKMFDIIWFNASKDGLVTLANYLNTQANTLICSSVLGLTSTGSYGLAIQLGTISCTIAGIPFSSALPKLQEKAAKRDLIGGRRIFSGSMLLFVVSFLIITGLVLLALPIIKLLKPSLDLNVYMFLSVFILLFIDRVYHFCASLISTFNNLLYTKAFIVSSALAVLFSFILTKYTELQIWGLIVAPIIVAVLYNLWKWPMYVLKIYDISFFALINEGRCYANDTIKNSVNSFKRMIN